jgi:hypothetical protein
VTDEAVTYEDKISEAAEKKRDADVVLHPTFRHLKQAFSLIFAGAGMNGSDFKRLSDFQYYQGGYPSPTTPPKESSLAYQLANIAKLEGLIEKDNFANFVKAEGVKLQVEFASAIPEEWMVSKDDEKKLREAWEGAGIDVALPNKRSEVLTLLLDRSQKLQAEICETNDFIKDLAETVEEKFQIKKTNFMKVVALAALRLRRGDGVMGEKVDTMVDVAENFITAVEPLIKAGK